MHEIISCISTTVLFILILWTSSLKLCLCDGNTTNTYNTTTVTAATTTVTAATVTATTVTATTTAAAAAAAAATTVTADTVTAATVKNCDFTENYNEAVTISVQEPVYVTKYRWCFEMPPRCPESRQEYRTVLKNITVPKTRTVRRCCIGYIQLYDDCIPKCTEDKCPNIQCAPGTNKCKCKSGFTGPMCRQTCAVGYWGNDCKNICHKACSHCDHNTGCCYAVIVGGRIPVAGLKFCATKRVSVASGQDDDGDDANIQSETRSEYRTQEPRTVQTTPAVKSNGPKVTQGTPEIRFTQMSAEEEMIVEEPETTSVQQLSKTRNNSGGFVGTVTTMRVTVYKYDELVTKLIWISVMTVVAIAMVFIIMFVVFFNCYGVSKLDDCRTQNRRMTSIMKNDEKCKQTLSHIPPDRYTKAPVSHTSANADVPIHPEIFCPVFSAPHYTGGSALYDSPQPLYEILC